LSLPAGWSWIVLALLLVAVALVCSPGRALRS
jgi:hypothetical protein